MMEEGVSPSSIASEEVIAGRAASKAAVGHSGAAGGGFRTAAISAAKGVDVRSSSGKVEEGGFREGKDAPLQKLTCRLLSTYLGIYEQRLAARQRKKRRALRDPRSDYKPRRGDLLGENYEVVGELGKGSFGTVVVARDVRTGVEVAVKVIKKLRAFTKQAMTEVSLLKEILRRDRADHWCIVRMVEQFDFDGHTCIVFEKLSYNLYELLRSTRFQGVSLKLVRKFGRQVLGALVFLSHHHVRIIHCDLKPENILLRDPRRSAIKVIDFGSSCKVHRRMYSYIQSRFYRSPEVMMGMRYGLPIDMWSLGCILVEMHTGKPLFDGDKEFAQVCRFVNVLGMPPQEVILKAPKYAKYFDRHEQPDGSMRFTLKDHPALKRSKLAELLGIHTGGPNPRHASPPPGVDEDSWRKELVEQYPLFLDVIKRMLDFNPATRLKPLHALHHPFFMPSSSSSSGGGGSGGGAGSGSSSHKEGEDSAAAAASKEDEGPADDPAAVAAAAQAAAKAAMAAAVDGARHDLAREEEVEEEGADEDGSEGDDVAPMDVESERES
eukprot:PLAT7045.26.p1 GENE.PLAT7045.26~~PLAT7045.26.p1  ORF type:complete len:550 (+),score=261.47 PLAT7045.26:1164-2813(+)